MARVTQTLALGALAASAACHGNRSEQPPVHLIQNMDFQARFDAQEQNDFFKDVDCAAAKNHDCFGRAQRLPVPGTVAVGQLKDDDEYHRGRGPDGRLFDRLPSGVKLSPQLLARGEQRYNIYCQPCHDATGDGKGVATRRGGGFKVAPANFHDPRLTAMPLAYFVDVINNGKGTMLPYAAQVPIEDRWAIAAWGSRYFLEKPPIADYEDLDRRMRNGELSLAIEIPPGFARDIARGTPVAIGAWVDGAMPTRAETVRGYVQAMHGMWLADMATHRLGITLTSASTLETRYRYNADVRSLPAMVQAVIPMLLMMIPAMLAALSVVREKELGSIINLYVTPVTRSEFLLGKQLPYVVLAMINYLLLTALAVTVFGVPIKGSFATLTLAALIFVVCSTGFGLLASTFTRSQIAALFVTIIGTIIPCVQFSGLLNLVPSLEGVGAIIGRLYPATHFLTISRGVFSKALDISTLAPSFWPLLAAVPIILGLAIVLLF